MTTSKVWKEKKSIKYLKEEFEQNKTTYNKNIELLNIRLELEKSNLDDFNFEQKKYNLTRDIIEIELKNYRVITPLMEFHRIREWQEKWKELKEFENENNERNYKIAQKNFEVQKARIEVNINIDKIKDQQKRIEEKNPIILKQLKKFGVIIDEIKDKIEYAG